jgi:hypothetical protein
MYVIAVIIQVLPAAILYIVPSGIVNAPADQSTVFSFTAEKFTVFTRHLTTFSVHSRIASDVGMFTTLVEASIDGLFTQGTVESPLYQPSDTDKATSSIFS